MQDKVLVPVEGKYLWGTMYYIVTSILIFIPMHMQFYFRQHIPGILNALPSYGPGAFAVDEL